MKKYLIGLKKILAVSFAIILGLCGFTGCSPKGESLDGKKIIFIGNSYTYYGQTVLEKTQKVLKQEDRMHDKGYFYQLCQDNGMNVDVTNWTFGGHSLEWLFGGNCAANRGCDGVDHASYLTDRNYDYVVIQSGNGQRLDEVGLANIEMVMDFFKAGNPNTKFVLLIPYSFYGKIGSSGHIYLMKNTLNSLKTFASKGVIIVDWGGLVTDILDGKVQVPNATQEYTKNTFVVSKDNYHPSVLSGYITTLMTYCAITGEKAQGKTYDFCNDPELRDPETSEFFNFRQFEMKYYTGGTTGSTNFDEVFASENDMKGIQKLIDKYLSAKAYKKYNFN